MSFRATALKRPYLAVMLMFATVFAPSHAQDATTNADSPVIFDNHDAITVSQVSPLNQGGTSSSGSSDKDKWLKLEVHLSATKKLTLPFVDEIQIKVWVEGRDNLDPEAASPEGVAVGIAGSVTYVNVPADKDIYGVVYLHPATLARYCGKGTADDFGRKYNIHAEIYVAGKVVDAIDKNKDNDLTWYQKVKPVTGLVFKQNQCPFLNADPSRYPELKLPASE